MKKVKWKITLGLSLIMLSVTLYFLHYLIFHDPHHILIYFVGDVAFVPIEVLMVTLIIHKVLEVREKRAMLEKLNMVIGVFFSEVGTDLLRFYKKFDENPDSVGQELQVKSNWNEKQFRNARKKIRHFQVKVNSRKGDLDELKNFMKDKRDFLLVLLENPNILEHESFTDLLWAVFHMTEELCLRDEVLDLPQKDYDHLSGDIKRVYSFLFREWVDYMYHLKKHYPYLFSLALRTNPFDKDAKVEVG